MNREIWNYDFIAQEYGIYQGEKGCGFVERTSSMPSRTLWPDKLAFTSEGVAMPPCPEHAYYRNVNDFDYVGFAFRIDVPEPGAYHLEVELASEPSGARVAVNGVNPDQISQQGFWDAAELIPRVHTASFQGNVWRYDFVCGQPVLRQSACGNAIYEQVMYGQPFLEIEVEPADPGLAVGVRRITVSRLAKREKAVLPTMYTLGDSTVKSYIYEENLMSACGQIFDDLFDAGKVRVLNYAMGGRSLATMYREGRMNDLLLTACHGDYLLLQSGHNDESRGPIEGPEARYGRGNTEESFLRRLEEYFIPAAKAMGVQLILVTPMTRIHGDNTGAENGVIFGGFAKSGSIDCPGLLRHTALKWKLPLVDLYEEGNHYLESIGGEAAKAMFLSVEAGETAGKTNSGSYANGHPGNVCDGTHYKEALSKQFARIVASALYQQRFIPESFFKGYVREAIVSGNAYKMFPEMCRDVQTGRNAYYRNQIEFVVKHHIMGKKKGDCFWPMESTSVSEFREALCRAVKLDHFPAAGELSGAGSLLSPDSAEMVSACKGEGELTRETMALLVYRVYLYCFPVPEIPANPDKIRYTKPPYMTDYNGTGIAFDDPNYDPNLTGESAMYYPLVPWEKLEDRDRITSGCLTAVRECYRLGLIRSEAGIARGRMRNGTVFEPEMVVTREKAAKELYFLQTLVHGIREETDRF